VTYCPTPCARSETINLADETFERVYSGELRVRILAVVVEMEKLRQELDTPPSREDRRE
jgi:hypothetical protein